MKLQFSKEYWRNCEPLTPIPYKANPTISKTLTDKLDSLKGDIKKQPGERDSYTVAVYVPVFCTGSLGALLKFVTTIHKIIRGQDLSIGTKEFGMTRNLVIVEALQCFQQEAQERGAETNANCKLVMKDMIYHLFPQKRFRTIRGTSEGDYTNFATQRLGNSSAGSTRWSNTSISSLPLGLDNAYQKTISSSQCIFHSWRSGRKN